MSIRQLVTGLASLRDFATGPIPHGVTALLLEVMGLCLEVLTKLSLRLRESADPRAAAAHASLIENIFRYTVREQIRSLTHLEATAAHLLCAEELTAIRRHRTDFSRPAVQETGRTAYANASTFSAAWLGIDFFEADRRLSDAHLLIARRFMDGSAITPRFTQLAALHAEDQKLDPRRVAHAARSLDKFEPPDTSFEGAPLDPAASYEGQSMQERAVTLLREADRATGAKKLKNLLRDYRKANKECVQAECGLFYQGNTNGVDSFLLRSQGLQSEQLHSFVGQSDNPRTESGQAARKPAPLAPADLFTSADPVPDWAQDPAPEPTEQAEPTKQAEPNQSRQESAPACTPPAEPPADPAPEASELEVSVAQRRLNALLASLSASNTGAKTVTPQVLVHMQASNLSDLASATAVTAHGVPLEPAELRQLLCGAKIIPIVFGGKGQVLDVGRAQRLFPEPIKKAAFARDRGCIVPGCNAPHEMLEYHHCNWWERGGKTCIENCAVLCRHHHALIHRRLLRIQMVGSVPHIVLPEFLDPDQIPRRNSYFSIAA
ncbi:HNH endonuclease signature motif containing protein [Glutamicibacter sp.]|jgi:hypothetical protein|uniref:HNH endonuclease signature motif containing protein n=1 Tax=Glutamicibacter sp. TaxID=1931995 RepID=UPI002B467918|nr:HNH endonuclease signature motif containing protein [Glutamicibacter sp.]HJX77108.1 HNH endonuclease signature motif containing protein [Glutamicibacter sp.]